MAIHVVVEVAGTAKLLEVDQVEGENPLKDFERAQKEMDGLVRLGRGVFRVPNVAAVIIHEEEDAG